MPTVPILVIRQNSESPGTLSGWDDTLTNPVYSMGCLSFPQSSFAIFSFQNENPYAGTLGHNPSSLPYVRTLDYPNAEIVYVDYPAGNPMLLSGSRVKYYATDGTNYAEWRASTTIATIHATKRLMLVPEGPDQARLTVRWSNNKLMVNDVMIYEACPHMEFRVDGSVTQTTGALFSSVANTNVIYRKPHPSTVVFTSRVANDTREASIVIDKNVPVQIRFGNNNGEQTNWMDIKFFPIQGTLIGESEDESNFTFSANNWYAWGSYINSWRWRFTDPKNISNPGDDVAIDQIVSVPSFTHDFTDLFTSATSPTNVNVRVDAITAAGCSSFSTAVVPVSPGEGGQIGACIDHAGHLYSAVKDPNNANNIQCFRFKGGVGSRETLANIANAKNPSLRYQNGIFTVSAQDKNDNVTYDWLSTDFLKTAVKQP